MTKANNQRDKYKEYQQKVYEKEKGNTNSI